MFQIQIILHETESAFGLLRPHLLHYTPSRVLVLSMFLYLFPTFLCTFQHRESVGVVFNRFCQIFIGNSLCLIINCFLTWRSIIAGFYSFTLFRRTSTEYWSGELRPNPHPFPSPPSDNETGSNKLTVRRGLTIIETGVCCLVTSHRPSLTPAAPSHTRHNIVWFKMTVWVTRVIQDIITICKYKC